MNLNGVVPTCLLVFRGLIVSSHFLFERVIRLLKTIIHAQKSSIIKSAVKILKKLSQEMQITCSRKKREGPILTYICKGKYPRTLKIANSFSCYFFDV